MDKRALEKERIEQLGYMVPLASLMNNQSSISNEEGTSSQGISDSQIIPDRRGQLLEALSKAQKNADSAIPLSHIRAEMELATDTIEQEFTERLSKNINLTDVEEHKSQRKSILRSSFRRQPNKRICFSAVETQADEDSDDEPPIIDDTKNDKPCKK